MYGRNLLRNSDNGWLDSLAVYNPSTQTSEGYVDGWRRFSVGDNQFNHEIVQENGYRPDTGGEYTFSILCRTDAISFTTNVSFYTHEQGHRPFNANITLLENNTYRISATAMVSNLYNLRIVDLLGFSTVGATYVEFRYPKFEKGNHATDWTPAPEDVSSSLSGWNLNWYAWKRIA